MHMLISRGIFKESRQYNQQLCPSNVSCCGFINLWSPCSWLIAHFDCTGLIRALAGREKNKSFPSVWMLAISPGCAASPSRSLSSFSHSSTLSWNQRASWPCVGWMTLQRTGSMSLRGHRSAQISNLNSWSSTRGLALTIQINRGRC